MYYLTFRLLPLSPVRSYVDVLTRIKRRDLNRLVLDYLILEGYRTAAESFASEAATDLPSNAAQQVEDANIEMRILIKEKVESGDVMAAIEMCNDLNPEVCFFLLLPISFSSLPSCGGFIGLYSFMHHS
jgi:LisH